MSFEVTLEQARTASPLLTKRFPDGDGDDGLQSLLDAAEALVGSLTCRAFGAGAEGEEVPEWLEPLALRAVVLKAEEMYLRTGTIRSRSRGSGSGNLRSFTAGPYSESYFGPEEASKARVLALDPSLHEVLWALASEDCRAAWLALWNDEPIPASAVQSFEWSDRPGNYGGRFGGSWWP